MKRILTYQFVLMAIVSLFIGCSKVEKLAKKQEDRTETISIESIVTDITTEVGINTPVPIDEEALSQFIAVTYTDSESLIKVEDIEEFYGMMCTSNVSSDFIFGVKTSHDKQQFVVDVLETIRTSRVRSFDGFIDSEYQKANNAKVITVGDYAFLAIIGDPGNDPVANAKKIEEMILSYFDLKD